MEEGWALMDAKSRLGRADYRRARQRPRSVMGAAGGGAKTLKRTCARDAAVFQKLLRKPLTLGTHKYS